MIPEDPSSKTEGAGSVFAEGKAGSTCRVSVIVPARNEAGGISATLDRVVNNAGSEVLVVDGGSEDNTVDIARKAGARCLRSAPGRAAQMNAGAVEARGDILLFLHADTLLPPDYRDHVESALAGEGVIAGAFRLAFDDPRLSLRLIASGANLRSRYRQLPYGDQALFLRRETFECLGGFRELPVMEDYDFVRRLRRRGRVALTPAHVKTSARRWLAHGIWRTTLTHQCMVLGWRLGVSPERLAAWGGRKRP